MSHFRAAVAIILLMMILVSACAPAAGETVEAQFADFDPGNFDNPTVIDNEWMPMKPGTKWVQEGTAVEGGESITRRIDFTITDLTKVIGGVRTAVTWDLDYSDGELVEAELAFFAQDKDGNIWRMGEYPEEYDGKKLVGHPAWIHGFEDAHAGIMMKGSPATGTPSYSEGWGPAVHWTDRGQVDSVGVKTCVPVDCYDDVLVIAESSQTEVNAQQLKYYARGVGNVRVGWRGAGEKTRETLELVKLERLDAAKLTEVRAKALELEKSAYKNSPDLYGKTPPSVPGSGS